MKTKEELSTMSKEDLVKQVESEQFMSGVYEKENKRLKEILSAIGIVYETYKTEYVKH
ncbi:hypothetical protein [Parabacteroides pacaensis]|uniref:hypothetical protein n=1 Tax=Parabacteroides pacaensis TaxID=2086575 RepID=UPI00131DF3D1|nr:hypothetical protein [Parabacteroides pacaensis]